MLRVGRRTRGKDRWIPVRAARAGGTGAVGGAASEIRAFRHRPHVMPTTALPWTRSFPSSHSNIECRRGTESIPAVMTSGDQGAAIVRARSAEVEVLRSPHRSCGGAASFSASISDPVSCPCASPPPAGAGGAIAAASAGPRRSRWTRSSRRSWRPRRRAVRRGRGGSFPDARHFFDGRRPSLMLSRLPHRRACGLLRP